MRDFRAAMLLACAVLVAGCATSVPRDHESTPSAALVNPEDTRLGQLFQREVAQHPGESGVALVPTGATAFRVRAGLANLAQRTLDVQYYIWELDTTGIILAERLVRAADRGVRVRMLLDHITTKSTDIRFAELVAHPNIEVRLFNPFTNRRFRALELAFGLERLNHRMHNKSFVADNALAIVGGRNIGDNYFGVDAAANFRDLDLAVVGPVVREISDSFDRYWNSEFAVPIGAVTDTRASDRTFEDKKEALYRWVEELDGFPYPIDTTADTALRLLDEARDSFIWAPARALYDAPDKLQTDKEAVAEHLIEVGRGKDHESIVESAYVIPGPAGVERARRNKELGIRQRLLTNSLATNDVAAAHAGYARYRFALIRNGVELYELRPDAGSGKRDRSLLAGRSKASLHTKAFVVDREQVAVGSFNVDPRSIALNTEIVILVDSAELAARVLAYMDEGVRPENSYRVVLEFDPEIGAERLVWITRTDGKEVRYRSEPETGLWRRVSTWLIGLLPIEQHL